MPLSELVRVRRADILRTASKYGAYNVRIFGSVARGGDDDQSGLDLLVDMESSPSLFDLGGFLILSFETLFPNDCPIAADSTL